jgi:hypothetical protein
VNQPLWFSITLVDCNGQNLASWNYDETWPVGAPHFSYPNQDALAAYVLQFRSMGYQNVQLPANVDLNAAIHVAVAAHVQQIRKDQNV